MRYCLLKNAREEVQTQMNLGGPPQDYEEAVHKAKTVEVLILVDDDNVATRVNVVQNVNATVNTQVCFKCHQAGHLAKECKNFQNINKNCCYNCGKNGHYSRNCTKPRDRLKSVGRNFSQSCNNFNNQSDSQTRHSYNQHQNQNQTQNQNRNNHFNHNQNRNQHINQNGQYFNNQNG